MFNIPEVWLWQNENLQVFYLKSGSYEAIAQSQFLPNLNLDILTKYINYSDQYVAVTEFIKELNS